MAVRQGSLATDLMETLQKIQKRCGIIQLNLVLFFCRGILEILCWSIPSSVTNDMNVITQEFFQLLVWCMSFFQGRLFSTDK